MKELAAFRAQYILPVEQELASALALANECALSASTRTAVLRGSTDAPGQRRAEGAQQTLLRAARDLSPTDAEVVYQQIVRASARAGVSSREFSQRWNELADHEVVIPTGLTSPSLLRDSDATYYVEPRGEELSGVAVDLRAELATVAAAMRAAGLLDAEDELEAKVAESEQDLESLAIALRSPAAVRARQSIEDRYLVKLALIGLCGMAAVALAGLGMLLQRRRTRILELKSHFVAGVSHELRTPLASMRVLAETLERRTQGVADVRDYPTRLLRDIDGMAFLVENILSFNRLTKGRLVAKREAMNLRELVIRAVDDVREHTGKAVELEVEPATTRITGDPELLSLLFRNVVANSVAYNRRQPVTISVQTRVSPRQGIEVLVRDNGVGISDGDRRKIFGDFYRGQAAAMARGSGLGLALCKRISELHRGTISVRETSPEGTTIAMVFP